MFAKADGPTALRREMVQALSLSLDAVELSIDGESGRACAALSAVWNGRKGYVVLLVRGLDAPVLQRFCWSQALLGESELSDAVGEGVAFAEGMGFAMDAPEFQGLPAEAQARRLRTWDDLRKVDRTPVLPGAEPPAASDSARQALARIAVERRVVDPSEVVTPAARLLAQF